MEDGQNERGEKEVEKRESILRVSHVAPLS